MFRPSWWRNGREKHFRLCARARFSSSSTVSERTPRVPLVTWGYAVRLWPWPDPGRATTTLTGVCDNEDASHCSSPLGFHLRVPALFIVGRDRVTSYFWRHAYNACSMRARPRDAFVKPDPASRSHGGMGSDFSPWISRGKAERNSRSLNITVTSPANLGASCTARCGRRTERKSDVSPSGISTIGLYIRFLSSTTPIADEVHELKGDTARETRSGRC